MALEKEMKTYKAKLHELLKDEGKFVLIRGDDIIDTFTSYEDAIKAGYKNFGIASFMVKQIHSVEEVQFISRFIEPAKVCSA